MSAPVYQPPDLQRLSLTPEGKDFALYTDGSGHVDGFGGHAVICVSSRHKKFFVRAGAICGTDTERQELEAMLNGLQGIMDVMNWNNHHARRMLEHQRATVFWLTDRKHLVGSVMRGPDGNPLFSRRSTPDLWARFAFYEKFFAVDAVHRDRNTNPYQTIADQISSECRTLIKGYVGILQADKTI